MLLTKDHQILELAIYASQACLDLIGRLPYKLHRFPNAKKDGSILITSRRSSEQNQWNGVDLQDRAQ
jgi:hypothetical protein